MTEDILKRANAILEDPDPTCGWTGTMIDLIAEVERLRSQSVEQVFRKKNEELAAKDTRIKELVAEKRRLEARVEYCHDQTKLIKLFEAAFLKLYVNQLVGCNMPREVAEKHARKALERIKEGGKDEN